MPAVTIPIVAKKSTSRTATVPALSFPIRSCRKVHNENLSWKSNKDLQDPGLSFSPSSFRDSPARIASAWFDCPIQPTPAIDSITTEEIRSPRVVDPECFDFARALPLIGTLDQGQRLGRPLSGNGSMTRNSRTTIDSEEHRYRPAPQG